MGTDARRFVRAAMNLADSYSEPRSRYLAPAARAGMIAASRFAESDA